MKLNENIIVKIDFSALEEIYSDNYTEYLILVKKIQEEYAKYLVLLTQQIQSENWEEFRKTRHKISATLLLLKLDHFHEYLTYLKEHFSKDFRDKEVTIQNLQKCFGQTQEILAKKISEFENIS